MIVMKLVLLVVKMKLRYMLKPQTLLKFVVNNLLFIYLQKLVLIIHLIGVVLEIGLVLHVQLQMIVLMLIIMEMFRLVILVVFQILELKVVF